MKLHFSPASPFARKVRIAAFELGVADKIEVVPQHVAPGKRNSSYASRFNPLRRIPTLTLDDGTTIIDSQVICEYLDNLDGRGQLVPKGGARRWRVLSDYAVVNGMTEMALLLRHEQALRPQEFQWGELVDDHLEKLHAGLAWSDKKAEELGERFELTQIALACLLGYLDLRFGELAWRDQYPGLRDWHAEVAQRPSYQNTEPNP